MAQGSGCTLHISVDAVPYHPEALEFASMGLVPAGAYRNRKYAGSGVKLCREISLAMQDTLYDPQTRRGPPAALPETEAMKCLRELQDKIPQAAIVGYVT